MSLWSQNVDATIKQLIGLIDVPALVLALLLLLALLVMWRAQRRADFDWADMLRDAEGKPSAMRFAVMVAVASTTWVLMKASVQKSDDLVQILWAYLLAWSGAPVLRELAQKWNGVLPWGKP